MRYTKTKEFQMVLGQVQFCRHRRGGRWNTTCTVQKLGFCQARATKYMGIPPYAHWALRILHPVLAPISARHQTLEVHLVKSASTRHTISKGGDGTNAEHIEYRKPKVTGKVKEGHFISTYFSNTIPL